MLNADGQRELAYVTRIDAIEPIEGSDNCECACVLGWRVMVRKGTFQEGDLAIYFEVDSQIDITKPEFAFLAAKHGKIKTQRYTFGGKGKFISQGLLMSFKDFGWTPESHSNGDFVTKELGVTYTEPEDNYRKATIDPCKSMMDRHAKLFKSRFGKWIMKRKWGRKIMLFLFGSKRNGKKEWPVGKFPGVSKTDQERIENMPYILEEDVKWICTQKCDGSSATYILEKKPFGRYEFYVCSRNVRMNTPKDKCYHSENVYWEMAFKYDIEAKMKQVLKNYSCGRFVCWQGEICGPSIQKNPHGLSENHLFLFHWTDGGYISRWDIRDAVRAWKAYGMETVPVEQEAINLPKDLEELKLMADGQYDPSVCEGKTDRLREGFVYYSVNDPRRSFKNVSREYLLSK